METSFLSTPLNLSPFAARPTGRAAPILPRRLKVTPLASKRDTYGWDYGGGLVDQNMIVLRKRIHEMKLSEANYEPPAGWSEWEKEYYTSYDQDVCELLGVLQIMLMNMRPSLAIGMVALVTLSVPTSAFLVAYHLIEASKVVLLGSL